MDQWKPDPNARRKRLAGELGAALANGLTHYEDAFDEDAADMCPAWKFSAFPQCEEEAARRWAKAEIEVAFEGVCPTRRIARIDSPIWFLLSDYGLPFEPFDMKSGGLHIRAVHRTDAVALHLLDWKTVVGNGVEMWRDRITATLAALPADVLSTFQAVRDGIMAAKHRHN